MPNIFCGSYVTAFDRHFGRPHIFLCGTIILLSSF